MSTALATPIRTCGATQARLPLFFLLGFHLWRHPETGAPWYLPTGLSDARPNFGAQPGSARNSQTLTAGTESEDYGESQPELLKPLSRLPEAGKLRLPATQPEGRMVGRCSVVRDSKELVGKSRGWNRIIPKRLLERNVVKPREIIWREDMESFVLRLLRDRVVQRLKNLLHGGSGYLAKSTGGLDGINEVEVGCVLWLGPTTVPIRDGIGVPFDTGMPPLPKSARIDDSMDLATMNYSGMQVPVHNLAKLLGKKHLELLRKPGSYFDSEITIIKHKLNTLPARRQLWRLEGYLAD
ncbi:MAG: hypothetical protein M1812_000161 [Candelaria pacifica]|nr:MAG: hypothetical protein M1812_000161 [Candelaria pacifica]